MRRNHYFVRAALDSIVSDLTSENRTGLLAWLAIPSNRKWAEGAVMRIISTKEGLRSAGAIPSPPPKRATHKTGPRGTGPIKVKIGKPGQRSGMTKLYPIFARRGSSGPWLRVGTVDATLGWRERGKERKKEYFPTEFGADLDRYFPEGNWSLNLYEDVGELLIKPPAWISVEEREDMGGEYTVPEAMRRIREEIRLLLESFGQEAAEFSDPKYHWPTGAYFKKHLSTEAPTPVVTATPSPPPKRRATVKGVNKALSALGFTSDELEFVRGKGYFYVSGEIPMHLYETGLYGISPRVSDLSVDDWVRSILSHVMDDQNFASLTKAQQAKIERALESQNA